MKPFLIILLFTVSAFSSEAQTTLQGSVVDGQHKPLAGVTVELLGEKDSVLRAAQTDTPGRYAFSGLDSGRYRLRFSMTGFRGATQGLHIIGGETLTLPDVVLAVNEKNLQNVTVSALTPPVQAQQGKLVYNVQRSISAAGSTAFDLLQRTPGITVDGEDRLLLKGNVNTAVMIDGKMTYLSPAQLTALFKSTPSENLQRIEVVANPGSQYDAAGAAGIINIVTKRSNRQGFALDLTSGAGKGRFGQTTQNVVGNIRRGRTNVYAGYTYGYKKNLQYRTSYRTVVNNGVVTHFDRSADEYSASSNHSYKAGVDLTLSKRSEINLGYNGFRNGWKRNGSGPTFFRDAAGRSDSVVNNVNRGRELSVNNGYHLRYKTVFDSAGKTLTADADYIRYQNTSDGLLGNGIFTPDGAPLQPYEELLFRQPGNIAIRSYKADLTLPLKAVAVAAGLKYSDVEIDNNFRYDSLHGGAYVFSKLLSNRFIYTEKIAAAYGSVQVAKEKTTYVVGLRAEHTASNADAATAGINTRRDYLNLFPNVSISRILGDDNVSLSVSRRINRPAYGNLNIARFFFDKFSYYEGNPYLRPEYAWTGELSYTLKKKYTATFSYTYTTDPVLSFATLDNATGNLRLTTENFERQRLYSLLLVVPWQPAPWWQVQQTANLYYQDFQYPVANRTVRVRRPVADLAANSQFQIAKETRAELNVHYTSPSPDGVYIIRRFFSVDGGVQQSLFRKKLTARFSFTDLFRTIRSWGYLIDEVGQVRYNHRSDTRRINLSLAYHFGGKLSVARDKQVEEQDRL